MLMASEGNDKSKQVVNEREVARVGDAFGLNNEQTLERVNNFLNLLPLVRILSQLQHVTVYYLVNPLVFLNEYQQ